MTRQIPTLAVGTKLWRFDCNRRKYECDAKGHATGGPIWREHWAQSVITGETRVSWILDGHARFANSGYKIKKSEILGKNNLAFSEREVDERAFVHDNRYRISEAVQRISDPDTLRAIAALVGYEAPTPKTRHKTNNLPSLANSDDPSESSVDSAKKVNTFVP